MKKYTTWFSQTRIIGFRMDSLLKEHEALSSRGTLAKSTEDVQRVIDLLLEARNSIASCGLLHISAYLHALFCFPVTCADLECYADPGGASITLAKLQNPIRQSFEIVNTDLKEVYRGLGNYSKTLDKVRARRLLSKACLIIERAEIQG